MQHLSNIPLIDLKNQDDKRRFQEERGHRQCCQRRRWLLLWLQSLQDKWMGNEWHNDNEKSKTDDHSDLASFPQKFPSRREDIRIEIDNDCETRCEVTGIFLSGHDNDDKETTTSKDKMKFNIKTISLHLSCHCGLCFNRNF